MMSQTQEKHHQAELRQAFRLFDADGDGFITRDDLKRVMRNCGENLTDAELNIMFTKADINKDNLVDLKGEGVFLLKCDQFPDHGYCACNILIGSVERSYTLSDSYCIRIHTNIS